MSRESNPLSHQYEQHLQFKKGKMYGGWGRLHRDGKKQKKKNNRIMNFWLLKRNKLQGPSFGDFHIDLSRIVENGAPRVCYHNKFARRVDPK